MPVSSKAFLEIQVTIESRFTLKCVRNIIIIYSQVYCINALKSSQLKALLRKFQCQAELKISLSSIVNLKNPKPGKRERYQTKELTKNIDNLFGEGTGVEILEKIPHWSDNPG